MKPTLVFDLDGTLAETAADLMNALNVVLKAAGLPALPLEKKNELIGAGARRHVRQPAVAAVDVCGPAGADAGKAAIAGAEVVDGEVTTTTSST